MKFIRFGVLSPQKQVTYNKGTFHSAPCRKGIYAFPLGYIEKFLLGATSNPNNSSQKSNFLKDDNGNLIIMDDVSFYGDNIDKDNLIEHDGLYYKKWFINLLKKRNIKIIHIFSSEKIIGDGIFYVAYYKKPKIFDYDGEIWHHHYEELKMIPMVGNWVKTDIKTYQKSLKILDKIQKKEYSRLYKQDFSSLKRKDGLKLYSKDHLEVFIEKVK